MENCGLFLWMQTSETYHLSENWELPGDIISCMDLCIVPEKHIKNCHSQQTPENNTESLEVIFGGQICCILIRLLSGTLPLAKTKQKA